VLHAAQLLLLVLLLKVPELHGAHVRSAVAEPGVRTCEPGSHVVNVNGQETSVQSPFLPSEPDGVGWNVSPSHGEHVRSVVVVAVAE